MITIEIVYEISYILIIKCYAYNNCKHHIYICKQIKYALGALYVCRAASAIVIIFLHWQHFIRITRL